jgi:glutaminyl-peptide cyclotransferase
VLLTLSGLGILIGPSGCGSSAAESSSPNRFDADAAFRLVELQVEAGPRPAGSPQLRKLAVALKRRLPHGRFEAIPNEPRLRNVVGTLPGRPPAIVLGAHYDTLVKPRGFVGANNGAAGTAIVLQAAKSLAADRSTARNLREVRFALFDGEEPAAGLPEEGRDFYHEGLRGSRAYAAQNPDSKAMILLDYVGNEGLRLPREATSTPWLWERLVGAAERSGISGVFSTETGSSITDDHTPFLRSGVPAVDLIDWSYPGHSRADGLDKISTASLDAVGETVVELIEELRRE